MTPSTSNIALDALWSHLDAGEHGAVLEALPSAEGLGEPAALLRALALLDGGDPATARMELEGVLERNPENVVAALHRVVALLREGNFKEAGAALSGQFPLLPHRGFLWRMLATLWPRRLEIFSHGIVGLEEDEAVPTSEDRRSRAWAGKVAARGVSHFLKGEPARALRDLREAHRLSPSDESHAANAAFAALHCGRPGEARQLMEPFLDRAANGEAPPPQPDTIVCMAWALHDEGRHGEAVRLLALVEPDGPEDCYTHFLAAMCRMEMGDAGGARQLFDHGMSYYFIDTWEQLLLPFLRASVRWMGDQATP